MINQKIRLFLESIKGFGRSFNISTNAIQAEIIQKAPPIKEVEKTEQKEFIKSSTLERSPSKENSRLLSDLKNDKLKDEDMLLIYYILETGRFKLGTGWREVGEIENIKVWEEVQELKSILSTNYEKALKRLDMKNITEVSETTSHGNPREICLKENVKEELLNISDDLLAKINEAVTRNKNEDAG